MSEYDPNYVEEKHFYLLGSKVAIINAKNEVLLLKRSQLSQRPGGWDLPGGAVDAKESPQDAGIREVLEETGIVISEAKLLRSEFVDTHKDPWVMFGLSAQVDTEEVTLSWEHDEYIWVPVDQVEATELPEPYKDVVRLSQL